MRSVRLSRKLESYLVTSLVACLLAVCGCRDFNFDSSGHSPDNSPEVNQLFDAISEGKVQDAQKLIESGAGLLKYTHITDRWMYPIHVAARQGDVDILRILLEAGEDPNRTDSYGCTPIVRAVGGVFDGDAENSVRLLCEHGADVNHKTTGFADETALHLAASINHFELAELLIELGADVNAQCKGGGRDKNTPLHEAAKWPGALSVRVAKLLILNGADVFAKNGVSLTAREFAVQNNRTEMAEFLSAVEADLQKQDTPDDS